MNEALANDRPLARQDGQDVLWNTGLECELAESDGRQRSELGRLHHDGAPGCERGCEAPASDRHREVPRDDETDNAYRLLEGDVDAAGDRNLSAEEPLGSPRVVPQDIGDVVRLPSGIADCVTGIEYLELSELLHMVAYDIGESAEELSAVTRGNLTPALQGDVGACDGLVNPLE